MDRNGFLKERLSNFLQRLNPPRAMQSNAEAQKEEITDLFNRLSKLAPSKGYNDWWSDFTEHLLSNAIARTWPTIKEMNEAARAIAPKRPEFRDLTNEPAWSPDPYKINAQRIKNMQPVGEEWISGKQSEKLISRGLIEESDLDPYRTYLAHSTHY